MTWWEFGTLTLFTVFVLLFVFIVATILEKFEKSKMKKNCKCKMCKSVKKGLKDVKEGKVTAMKSIDKWGKEDELWKKKHPILYRLKQIYYSIRRFFIRIIDFFRYDIKAFVQRGKRGYAVRDVWGFDYYLAKVISKGIDTLINELHGYPCGLKNIRQWESILKKISKTFKTAEKITNHELAYLPVKEYSDKRRKDFGEFTKKNNQKHSYYRKKLMTLKQNKEYEEGWKLFQEYYFNLWD